MSLESMNSINIVISLVCLILIGESLIISPIFQSEYIVGEGNSRDVIGAGLMIGMHRTQNSIFSLVLLAILVLSYIRTKKVTNLYIIFNLILICFVFILPYWLKYLYVKM